MSGPRRLGLLVLLLVLPLAALAQTYQSFGDYRVYYGAFPSGFLQPEIAREHGVLRSRTRGVLTLALQEREAPAQARVRALATTEEGETRSIRMREIRSGDAVSYIGDFSIEDGQTLGFEIEIFPMSSDETLKLHFSQEFFTD